MTKQPPYLPLLTFHSRCMNDKENLCYLKGALPSQWQFGVDGLYRRISIGSLSLIELILGDPWELLLCGNSWAAVVWVSKTFTGGVLRCWKTATPVWHCKVVGALVVVVGLTLAAASENLTKNTGCTLRTSHTPERSLSLGRAGYFCHLYPSTVFLFLSKVRTLLSRFFFLWICWVCLKLVGGVHLWAAFSASSWPFPSFVVCSIFVRFHYGYIAVFVHIQFTLLKRKRHIYTYTFGGACDICEGRKALVFGH